MERRKVRTIGCLISTSCTTVSSTAARVLISRAIAIGACSGILYMESGAEMSTLSQHMICRHTVALSCLPRAPILVHIHQLRTLLLHQSIGCGVSVSLDLPSFFIRSTYQHLCSYPRGPRRPMTHRISHRRGDPCHHLPSRTWLLRLHR